MAEIHRQQANGWPPSLGTSSEQEEAASNDQFAAYDSQRMRLNLVVLRACDIEVLGDFYAALGMRFTPERHGAGPEHLAYAAEGFTLEIYPDAGEHSTREVRIGFAVDSVRDSFAAALANGGSSVSQPRPSPWGMRAVIRDPSDHIVELVSAN